MLDYITLDFERGPILILEPHADDTLISLGSTIKNIHEVRRSILHVITVCGKTSHNPEDSASYLEDLDENIKHTNWHVNDIIMSKKAHLDRESVLGKNYTLEQAYCYHNPSEDSVPCLAGCITDYCKANSIQTIIAPTGVQHPMHKYVRNTVFKVSHHMDIPYILYADYPYVNKFTYYEDYKEILENHDIHTITRLNPIQKSDKLMSFKRYYSSQWYLNDAVSDIHAEVLYVPRI